MAGGWVTLRQLNLNEIRRDPQIEQLLKPINILPNLEEGKPFAQNCANGKSRDLAAQAVGLSPIGETLTSVQHYTEVPCSVCGYVNVPGLVICWRCGECLDSRIKKLAEGQP